MESVKVTVRTFTQTEQGLIVFVSTCNLVKNLNIASKTSICMLNGVTYTKYVLVRKRYLIKEGLRLVSDISDFDSVLTFADFVNHTNIQDTAMLDELSNLCVNNSHFVEGFDHSIYTPFTVRNTISVHDDIIIQKDIDSVAFVAQDFPFLQNVNITLYPSPDYIWSYKNDTGVTYQLSFGSTNIPVYKILKNIELATSGGLIVNIFFPNMYRENLANGDRSDHSIPRHIHTKFYEEVLSKAITSCISEPFCTIPYKLKTATPGKGWTFHHSYVNNLIPEMRSIIDTSDTLSEFDNFFLVTWGLGLKAKFTDSSSEGYKTALSSVYNLDWNKIDSDCSWLDLGFSFFPVNPLDEKLTGFFVNYHSMIDTVYDTDDSSRLLNEATIRYDPFIFNANLGGFKYKNYKHKILLMQAYSLSKEDLYKRGSTDRHGRDFDPPELLVTSFLLISRRTDDNK